MTDGNTYAINQRLADQEEWDELQEVTAALEQAQDRIEELEIQLSEARQVGKDWFEEQKKARKDANAAGAKLEKAEARLKKECGFFVHCYWDANDREIGHFDICEILDAYDFGTVAEIEHVAVIAKTFEAQLPPADDSETDDLFEVCEHTQEAAEAKVAAEISRRATLAELKGEANDA